MRQLIAIVFLLGALAPWAAIRPATAATLVDLSIQSADIRTGEPVAGACYVIVDWSEAGCDKNRDGRVEFKGVPPDHYVVTQSQPLTGYFPIGDFPIDVQQEDDQVFLARLAPRSAGAGTFDIAIRPVEEFTNRTLTGGCFLLVGASDEGCDENNDGRIEFAAVKAGSYLVTATKAPRNHLTGWDVWIAVTGDGPRVFDAVMPEDAGQPNIVLLSVDAESGDYLLGACYIIEDASEEGCDENRDGRVDYAGVKPGVYTVTETKAPSAHTAVDDFILVVPRTGQHSFTVEHEATTAGLVMVDVAIVSRDANTGKRLPGACYIIEDWSNEGCDDNGDGQVDFKGIPSGRYAVRETRPPAGYRGHLGLQFLFSEPLGGGVQLVYVDHQRS